MFLVYYKAQEPGQQELHEHLAVQGTASSSLESRSTKCTQAGFRYRWMHKTSRRFRPIATLDKIQLPWFDTPHQGTMFQECLSPICSLLCISPSSTDWPTLGLCRDPVIFCNCCLSQSSIYLIPMMSAWTRHYAKEALQTVCCQVIPPRSQHQPHLTWGWLCT